MFDAIFSLDEIKSLKVFFFLNAISLKIRRDHLSPKISREQLIGHFDLIFELFVFNILEYFKKMFSYSSENPFEADKYVSLEDTRKKAKDFSEYIKLVISNFNKK